MLRYCRGRCNTKYEESDVCVVGESKVTLVPTTVFVKGAATQCGSVRHCARMSAAVHLPMCGGARGSVWQCFQRCVAFRQCAAV